MSSEQDAVERLSKADELLMDLQDAIRDILRLRKALVAQRSRLVRSQQENEQLWRVARRHTCKCTCIDLDVQHHDEACYYRLFAKEAAEIVQREREAQERVVD